MLLLYVWLIYYLLDFVYVYFHSHWYFLLWSWTVTISATLKSTLNQSRCYLEPKNFLRVHCLLLGSQNSPRPPDPLMLATLTFPWIIFTPRIMSDFAYKAPNWRKPATHMHFFRKKTILFKEWMKKSVALLTKKKWQKMNRRKMTQLSSSFIQCI